MPTKFVIYSLFFTAPLLAMHYPKQRDSSCPEIKINIHSLTPEDLVPKDCLERCNDWCNPIIDHGSYQSYANLYTYASLLSCCGSIPVTNMVGTCLECSDRTLFATKFFVAYTAYVSVLFGGVYIEDYAQKRRAKRFDEVEKYRARLLENKKI